MGEPHCHLLRVTCGLHAVCAYRGREFGKRRAERKANTFSNVFCSPARAPNYSQTDVAEGIAQHISALPVGREPSSIMASASPLALAPDLPAQLNDLWRKHGGRFDKEVKAWCFPLDLYDRVMVRAMSVGPTPSQTPRCEAW